MDLHDLKFRFKWDSCICLAALTAPHWWGGGFPRPSHYKRHKQRKSTSRVSRTHTGRAPHSGLLVPDGICEFAGFCQLPFIRVVSVDTPPATCQHACSPTALPTDRITELWDSCHFVWWEMGTENFQNTVNRFRWKMQIRKPLDSASGRPVCCGHSTPVSASLLHNCVK